MYRRELISVVPAFFGVIKKIFCGGFKFVECNPAERLAILVFIATLPLVPAIAVEDYLEALYGNTYFVGTMLIINGAMLFLSDRISNGCRFLHEAKPKHALTVGLFQVLALFPGLSRSGTTITAGRICGFERSEAVRFSFVLSIPTVLGANLVKIPQLISSPVPAGEIKAYAFGMIAAAITGIAAIKLLSYISKKSSFSGFSMYCFAVGAAALILG